MKIKKFKFKQILKLYLLKSKMYEQVVKKNNFSFSAEINLFRILSNFKKVLQIVFRFHELEKRILFIGVPKKLESKINKLTNHVAVPNNFDLQGIIFKTFKGENMNNDFKLLFPKLSKRPDLIVLFSSNKKETIFSESYFGKVPLIVFDEEQNSKNTWLNNSYNVQLGKNNFVSLFNKNIFFLSLNFLFKPVKKKFRKRKFNKFSKTPGKFVGSKKRF